ncbi:hypothetical protein pb186bvf_011033 [Paramecium bursaria]
MMTQIQNGNNLVISTNPGWGKSFLSAMAASQIKKTIIFQPTKELCIQTYKQIRQLNDSINVSRIGSLQFVSPVVELLSDKEFNGKPGHEAVRTEIMNNYLRRGQNWNSLDVIVSTPQMLTTDMKDANLIIIDEGDLQMNDPEIKSKIDEHLKQIICSFLIIFSSIPYFKPNFKHFSTKNIMKLSDDTEFMTQDLQYYLNDQKTIVFVDQPEKAESFAKLYDGFAYHSKQSSEQRISTIIEFQNSIHGVLFSTALGSRGLDFNNLDQVIVYDLPESFMTLYLQIGRLRKSQGKIIINLKNSEDSAKYNQFEQEKFTQEKNVSFI